MSCRLREIAQYLHTYDIDEQTHEGGRCIDLQGTAVALSIFIVEDNPALRASLSSALGELPQTDVIGASGTEVESLTWLVANPDGWGVALIDLFLKEGNGLGVLAGCRVRKASQKLVVLTNYATPEIRRRCIGLGADAVFDKTSELEQMLTYIRGLSRAM